MGNPAGQKRDFEALEKRRLHAVRLLRKKNLNQAEVARLSHVSRQTVSRWMKHVRAGGLRALRRAGRAGRRPQLTSVDRECLEIALRQSPKDYGFPYSVWTCTNVAELIAQEFEVEYHRSHVCKILKQLNWDRNQQRRWNLKEATGHKRPKRSRAEVTLDRLYKECLPIINEYARRKSKLPTDDR